MIPNMKNPFMGDVVKYSRNMVDYNVRFFVDEQAREILTYAICILLSIDDIKIQDTISKKIPYILDKMNIFVGDRGEISEIQRDTNYDESTRRLPMDRKEKFSSDVKMDRYVDFTGTQDYLSKEARTLYITLDDGSDYYDIVKQVALELLHLIRHHSNHNINSFSIESGLSTITLDNYTGNIGSSYRRHIEDYLSLWYIEKGVENCNLLLSDDPFWSIVSQDSESKDKVLDGRVENVLDKMNEDDVYRRLFSFVFDRKDTNNRLGRKYEKIVPDVFLRLDTLDGLLRMIQDYPLDDQTKDKIYQRCLYVLNSQYTYIYGDKIFVYK